MNATVPRAGAALIGAATLLAAAGVLAACGKKGVPQPPVRILPETVEGFEGRQRGDRVILSLLEPAGRTDGSAFEEAVVLRLIQLPEEGAAAAATGRGRRPHPAPSGGPAGVSWVVPREEWPAYRVEKRLEIPIAIASLELEERSGDAAGPAGRKLSFVAEIQEGKRKRSVHAGPVTLTLCAAPSPPKKVEVRLTASGILVEWGAPERVGSAVHVYRATGNGPFPRTPFRTLSSSAQSLLDDSVAPGTAYRYEVRLAGGADPLRCESDAVGAGATYVDIFAPAPPQGLAAAAEESLIRLFWTPNAEPDLAGYLVYRREGADDPFRPLTPQPIAETTYADTAAERGRRYTYVVAAVDTATPPNRSAWSEPAEERLP